MEKTIFVTTNFTKITPQLGHYFYSILTIHSWMKYYQLEWIVSPSAWWEGPHQWASQRISCDRTVTNYQSIMHRKRGGGVGENNHLQPQSLTKARCRSRKLRRLTVSSIVSVISIVSKKYWSLKSQKIVSAPIKPDLVTWLN